MTEQKLIDAAKDGHPEALDQLSVNHHSRIFLSWRSDMSAPGRMPRTSFKKPSSRRSAASDPMRPNTARDSQPGSTGSAFIAPSIFFGPARRQRRASTSLDALPTDPPSPLPDPEQISLEQGVSRLVRKHCNRLPSRQQIIFTMRYREYMKIRQIAVRLECSEGDIRSHLFRTTARLRRAFRASA